MQILSALEKLQDHFVDLCRRVFARQGGAKAAGRTGQVTQLDLMSLPRTAQLFLAHFLNQDSRTITMLERDNDARQILFRGWIGVVPGSTPGFVNYRMPEAYWNQITSLQPKFLTTELLHELVIYRNRKSAEYPWLWG